MLSNMFMCDVRTSIVTKKPSLKRIQRRFSSKLKSCVETHGRASLTQFNIVGYDSIITIFSILSP